MDRIDRTDLGESSAERDAERDRELDRQASERKREASERDRELDRHRERDSADPPRTSTGRMTAPKFGSATSGGGEIEPGPERD